MASLKHVVIQYVKEFHEQNDRAPTVREVLKRFKKDGLSSTTFYHVFPRGLKEACRLAGIPIPEERMQKTARATILRKSGRNVPQEAVLTLTEEQTKRLLGISHLEGGKDPHLIIDGLLDMDAGLRWKFKLSLKDIARVAVFLKYAVSIGWRINHDPDLLDCLTKTWNLELLNLEHKAMQYLVEVLQDAQARGWKPSEFADYVTKFYNEIQAYIMYEKGLISLEEFKRRVEPHVRA